MAVPENLTEMPLEIRGGKRLMFNGTNNSIHIMDEIYNKNYYRDKRKGLQEVAEAVKNENFGIIIKDFRDADEKSEYAENQWVCLYFSKIENRVFCIPILEGNDFLQLQTIHPANSEFADAYWKVHTEKLNKMKNKLK